jgi:hypothetical protein
MGTPAGVAVSTGREVFATPPVKRGMATTSLEYFRVRTVSADVALKAGEGQRRSAETRCEPDLRVYAHIRRGREVV